MKLFPFLAILAACSSSELSVSPNPMAFGEVDFNQPIPAEGYAIQEVFLNNVGENDLTITISQFDDERLRLTGSFVTQSPLTLATIGPGQFHTINVSVWNYDVEGGERDTLVSGNIQFTAAELKDPVLQNWSFTPVRIFDEDTDQ
jgi:hypothetical protein